MTLRDGLSMQGALVRSVWALLWTPSLTVTDPSIPRLPLETPGLEILDVAYTTAKTVRFEIIRRADNARYDWTDAAFKTEGWTIRQKPATEDGLTLGWYRGEVDPSLWEDGEYLLIVDDAAVATGPIRLTGFSVVAGRFALLGAGLARAVWCQDVAELDQATLVGVRAATWLGRLLRRFALVTDAKYTVPSDDVGSDVLYDAAEVIATLTHANDATTETIEDPL